MGLLSIFQRKADPAANSSVEPGDLVQQARTRARRRLVGAVLLLGIGIIGFPLVFETQPRPIPIDIPIEIPPKEGAAPLAMPPARGSNPPAASMPAAVAQARPASAEARPAAVHAETVREVERPASKPAERVVAEPTAKPAAPTGGAAAAAAQAAAKPTAVAKPAAPGDGDGSRAKALLEGKPSVAAESGRYVVQVGAFAEAAAARDVRLKVEKLGFKTYTQVAQTAAGSRIRVRVGPFATRAEADRALAKAKAAGLGAVVLTL